MTDLVERLTKALAGRYLFERRPDGGPPLLGRGGMATVFLARDLKHDRLVALKVLHPELAAALGPDRFLREIKLAAGLQHPHILPLFDSGETRNENDPTGHRDLYYTMPYVEGESLRDRLAREKQLPLEDAIRIADDVASALAHAHSHGIIHRDIKPENILLSGSEAIVADFGIARAINAAGGEQLTETGLAIGTAAYMSPEQASGARDLDGRSDLYSLGCVLYEMLAGHPPFLGSSAREIVARHTMDPVPPLRTARSTISPALEAVIFRSLAKTPADRFATATQFAQALAAPGQPVPDVAWRLPVSRRQLAWLALFGAVFVAVAIAIPRWIRRPQGTVIPAANVIAVVPFAPTAPDTALERLGQNLAITLSANLQGVGDIRTVDALTVLAQTEGKTMEYSTLDQAAALGHRLGASSVVHGTLTRDGAKVRFDLGLFTSDSATPVARAFVTASPDDITTLTDSATWALLRQVWRARTPPTPSLAAVTTRSLPALRAFLDGERAIVAGRWVEAEAAYATAIGEDSTFWLAYWRNSYARWWRLEEPDSATLSVALGHLVELPEKERMLAEVWADRLRGPPSVQWLSRTRALPERFPDYWPGWFEYADQLFHGGPLVGHDLREARAALERVLQLNPRLVPAWEHLQFVGVVLEDTSLLASSLNRIATLTTEDTGASANPFGLVNRMTLQLMRGMSFEGPLADSVVNWTLSLRDVGDQSWSSLWFWAAAQAEFSGRVLRRGALPQTAAFHRKGLALAWAARGNWDSALTTIDNYAERAGTDLGGLTPEEIGNTGASPDLARLDPYRIAVIGAWLGALDPGLATARREAAAEAVPRTSSPRREAELFWLDGILAASRGDGEGLRKARRHLATGDTTWTLPFDRSLAAFGLAMAGRRREAGDSLAALSWEWWNGLDAPYFTGINRLAAARWLAAEGDLEQAALLLPWHQAIIPYPVFAHGCALLDGVSYLEMARVEAARGNRQLAREYYQRFLQRYDAPSPRMRHLADEAREALKRLE